MGRRGRRIALVFAAGSLAAGCSLFVDLDPLQATTPNGQDAAPTDAGSDAPLDTGSDAAAPHCDPNAPFESIAVLLAPSGRTLFRATLSADELDGWFGSFEDFDGGGSLQALIGGTRMSNATSFTFGFDTVTAPDLAASTTDPCVTPDGLRLIYTVGNGPVGQYDIFTTDRADRKSPFPAGALLSNVSSSAQDVAPFVASDGALWISSSRNGPLQIFRAPPIGTGFGAPVLESELVGDGGAAVSGITLTHDLLTAYVTVADPTTADDIFVTHRGSSGDPFGALVRATELDSTGDDRADWISDDNCTLYFESTRDVSYRIVYVATKSLPK